MYPFRSKFSGKLLPWQRFSFIKKKKPRLLASTIISWECKTLWIADDVVHEYIIHFWLALLTQGMQRKTTKLKILTRKRLLTVLAARKYRLTGIAAVCSRFLAKTFLLEQENCEKRVEMMTDVNWVDTSSTIRFR